MHRLMTTWRKVVHDFGWPVLALFVAYSTIEIIMGVRSLNIFLLVGSAMGLVRLIGWLTIIATFVPQSSIDIPVQRPLSELSYFLIWGIADILALTLFWGLVSSESPYVQIVSYSIVFGRFVLAIFFVVIFRYSALDFGIQLKHWKLYLGLVILSFPIGKHLLQGEHIHILIGGVSLLMLFLLYLSNRRRWQGLADDLKSLRPYAVPIILCALITFVLQWVQQSDSFMSVPFRVFDTHTMFQGAMPEEFYYRLGLQTRLISFMPYGWASLLQGIAFSASHIPQHLARNALQIADIPWSLTPAIANALAGGYFWQRSKNLPATILFHMAVFM